MGNTPTTLDYAAKPQARVRKWARRIALMVVTGARTIHWRTLARWAVPAAAAFAFTIAAFALAMSFFTFWGLDLEIGRAGLSCCWFPEGASVWLSYGGESRIHCELSIETVWPNVRPEFMGLGYTAFLTPNGSRSVAFLLPWWLMGAILMASGGYLAAFIWRERQRRKAAAFAVQPIQAEVGRDV